MKLLTQSMRDACWWMRWLGRRLWPCNAEVLSAGWLSRDIRHWRIDDGCIIAVDEWRKAGFSVRQYAPSITNLVLRMPTPECETVIDMPFAHRE